MRAAGRAWPVDHQRGPAADFHGRDLPEPVVRALWWFEVTGPAVALGSTQRAEVVDAGAARDAGVEVVRRRSGGGAVWLAPDEVTWVDVLLPASDPRWDLDVGRAAHWLGSAWADALAALGVAGATVHTGGLERAPWSELVCFAGLGPGEVTVAGRKVVGISQRRTRAGARFQCAVLHRWDPRPLLGVLDLDPEARARAEADLGPVAAGVGWVSPRAVVDALGEVLTTY